MRLAVFNIYTYKEGKREESIQRPQEKVRGEPQGVRILGEWTALNGRGGYMLFETDKPDYPWTMAWNDLLNMEIVPVLNTEKEIIGLLSGG